VTKVEPAIAARWDDLDDVPAHCPHCSKPIGPLWWEDAPDELVERWIEGGGSISLVPGAQGLRALRLFDQTRLRHLNRRIRQQQAQRRAQRSLERSRERARAHYANAKRAAIRAEFAPPDELAFIPGLTREQLARWEINTLDALLRYPRMFYAVSLSYRHMHIIENALLATLGMRLRKR
jgi:hypothetical protein